MIYDDGHAGVGATSTSVFTVASSTDSLFQLSRGGAVSPVIFREGTDSVLVINAGGSDTLTLKAGNVGIGTTNPQTALDIAAGSGIRAALSSNGEFLNMTSANGYFVVNTFGGFSGAGCGGNGADNNNCGFAQFYVQNGTPGRVALRIRGNAGQTEDLLRIESEGGATQPFTVTGSGKVGIGTTNPGSILDIKSSGSSNVLFKRSAGTNAFNLAIDSNAEAQFVMTNAAGTTVAKIASAAPDLTFFNGGNVGIATTTPGSPLTVAGVIYSSSGGVKFPDGSTQTTAFSGGSQTVSAPNVSSGTFGANTGYGNYTFSKDASTPILYVDATNARVGIGTTSPNYQLHQYGSATTIQHAIQTTAIGNGVNLGIYLDAGDGPDWVFGRNVASDVNNTNFVIREAGVADRLSIKSGGNVGIGTTSPGTKLTVQGTNGQNAISLLNTAGTAVAYLWPDGSAGGEFTLQDSTGAVKVALGTDGRESYIANGNVGIGTASPGYKLDVVSGGVTTARFGTTSSDKVVVGGGAGKLDVGTVDPIYNIGGAKFATYMPSMTGVKEETTATVKLTRSANCPKPKACAIIDFSKTEKGSDAWLFYQTTDFGNNWKSLSALLTPGFEGQAWYEKEPQANRIILYGQTSGSSSDLEVSYRLTAPRFDHSQWPNTSAAESNGFMLSEK